MTNIGEYAQIASATIDLAQSGFVPTPLGEATKSRIETLFLCMAHIDAHIDTAIGSERQEAVETVVDFLRGSQVLFSGKSDFADSLITVRNLLAELSGERREQFVQKVEEILSCGEVTQTTKSPETFIAAREQEGRCMTELVAILSGNLYDNAAFRHCYGILGSMGTLNDSLADYPADKKAGIVRIAHEALPLISLRMQELGRELVGDRNSLPDAAMWKIGRKLDGLRV